MSKATDSVRGTEPDAAATSIESHAAFADSVESIESLEPGRRGEILDAALAVFAEKGYSGGSMRDIATRVGVSEPALYRYFAGKEALFLTLVRVIATHLRNEAVDILRAVQPESFRVQVAAALENRRQRITLAVPMLRTILPAAAHHPAVLAEIRTVVLEPMLGELDTKVAELDAAFGLEPDSASRRARVRTFMALFVGSLATSVVFGDEPDEATVDAIVRIMGWEGRV